MRIATEVLALPLEPYKGYPCKRSKTVYPTGYNPFQPEWLFQDLLRENIRVALHKNNKLHPESIFEEHIRLKPENT